MKVVDVLKANLGLHNLAKKKNYRKQHNVRKKYDAPTPYLIGISNIVKSNGNRENVVIVEKRTVTGTKTGS